METTNQFSEDKMDDYINRSQTIGAAIRRSARQNPKRIAIYDVNRKDGRTYAELDRRSNCLAHGLRNIGVKKGDHVALLMPNRIEMIEAYLGCAKLGVPAVPINYRLSRVEIEYHLEHSESKFIIFDGDFQNQIENFCITRGIVKIHIDGTTGVDYEALVSKEGDDYPEIRVESSDLFGIFYTAGTTGSPKGVLHTHEEYLQMAAAWFLGLGAVWFINREAPYLGVAPIFHSGALSLVMANLWAGIPVYIIDKFTPDVFWSAIAKYRIAVTWLVPTMVTTALEDVPINKDLSSLRVLVSAGAPLPYELRNRFSSVFPDISILNCWGQTENCGPITSFSDHRFFEIKRGSVGKPLVGIEIRIRRNTGEWAEAGEIGELIYKGPFLTKGYFRNPEANERAFRDGWFHSGDIGQIDEDGFVFLYDRAADMIVTGGENVFPAEVEDVLYSHPSVIECAVVGMPDEQWGEKICAFIVTNDSTVTEDDIKKHCLESLARYKTPKFIQFISELPKSSIGKVLRREVRRLYAVNPESQTISNIK